MTRLFLAWVIVILWFAGRDLYAAQNLADIFAAGQAALAKGDLNAAESAFRDVLTMEPDSLPARANLGVVYMRRKNWTRALAEFQIAEKQAPGNPGLELNIGLVHFHRGEFAEAITPFQSVIANHPDSLQARYLLGLCYFATEKYRQATAQLKLLWEEENRELPYLYVLALSANRSSDASLEKQALDRLFEVGHGSAEYHLFMGRAWLMRQRDQEAREELRKAVQMDPKLPFVHYSLGMIAAGQGDYAQAKAEFTKDLAVEPGLSFDYEEIGTVCVKLDQPGEAEQAFRHAIQLDPNAASAYLGLAKIDNASGRYAQALVNLNLAEKLDSRSASVHYLKAQALTHLNRRTEAKAEFAVSARLRQSTRDRLEEQVSARPAVDAQMGLQH
jgi:tetratricopeptide (TPR) repeat protein